MEMPEFSAFMVTNSKAKTPNPFVFAVFLGGVVLLISYILCIFHTFYKKANSKVIHRNSKNINGYFRKIFSQRTITIIQTIALSVILCTTMLGYMYYTDNGKDTPVERVYLEKVTYEIADGSLDMKRDNIAEYYTSSLPNTLGLSYDNDSDPFITADPLFSSGINDEIISGLSDTFAVGNLRQTILVLDSPHEKYENEVEFPTQNQNDLSTKHLYRCETKIANETVINAIIPYVTAGEIDIDKIKSGEEIIAVQTDDTFSPKETFEIASVLKGGDTMVGEIITQNVTVGATVTYPKI